MKKIIFPVLTTMALLYCANNKTFAQTDWHIKGNSGTSATTNFIGTTDNSGLSIRTKNKERIRISPAGNVGIGIAAPKQTLDVNGNINIGQGSFLFMDNHKVLQTDSSATTTFFGVGAGNNNSTGAGNTATGYRALYSNTASQYNTAVGTEALLSTTEGFNTATGWGALRANTTGWENTATGYFALPYNTTGIRNVAAGVLALYGNSTGSNNVAIGGYALTNTTSSIGNVAIGYGAGSTRNNGYYNIFIGEFADVPDADIYNSIALGRAAQATAPNQVRIGNSFTTSIGGYAGWSTVSDGRVKKNIKENVLGLSFINKLKPVTYNLDLDAAEKIVPPNPAIKKDAGAAAFSKTDIIARNAKQQVLYTGFVAQDVERAAKELGYDFSGVDAAKNDKDLYGLRYDEFVVPLVKAVQELSQKVEKLEAELAQKNADNVSAITSKTINLTDADLSQNNPNPFNHTTTISYTLPQQYQSAKILVTGKSGNTLREIKVSGNGSQRLTISSKFSNS